MAVRSINISDDTWKNAKLSGINISEFIEKQLRDFAKGKKDLPEDSIKAECSLCKKIIDSGYLCHEGQIVFCNECHDAYDIKKKCSQWHNQKEVGGNLLHFHNHFGKKREIFGQTLEDIEKGNPPHNFKNPKYQAGQNEKEMLAKGQTYAGDGK